jgi:hypothetical protein
VVEAETVEDVLAQAGPHAMKVHGVTVTPEMAEAIAGKMRDV